MSALNFHFALTFSNSQLCVVYCPLSEIRPVRFSSIWAKKKFRYITSVSFHNYSAFANNLKNNNNSSGWVFFHCLRLKLCTKLPRILLDKRIIVFIDSKNVYNSLKIHCVKVAGNHSSVVICSDYENKSLTKIY